MKISEMLYDDLEMTTGLPNPVIELVEDNSCYVNVEAEDFKYVVFLAGGCLFCQMYAGFIYLKLLITYLYRQRWVRQRDQLLDEDENEMIEMVRFD